MIKKENASNQKTIRRSSNKRTTRKNKKQKISEEADEDIDVICIDDYNNNPKISQSSFSFVKHNHQGPPAVGIAPVHTQDRQIHQPTFTQNGHSNKVINDPEEASISMVRKKFITLT